MSLKVNEDEWQVKQALKKMVKCSRYRLSSPCRVSGVLCVCAQLLRSVPILCDLPGSCVHGIFQARILECLFPDSISSSCYKTPRHRHSARSLVRDNIRVCRMQGKCISNRAFSLAICTQGMRSAQHLLHGKAAPEFRMQVTDLPW